LATRAAKTPKSNGFSRTHELNLRGVRKPAKPAGSDFLETLLGLKTIDEGLRAVI
jgi:hypothetical protein